MDGEKHMSVGRGRLCGGHGQSLGENIPNNNSVVVNMRSFYEGGGGTV